MSTPTTWQEAARGIEPWDGAKLLNGLRCLWYWNGLDGPCGVTVRHEDGRTQCGVWPLTQGGYNPDLADPDTRAAFDRRLALRLGAPAAVEGCHIRMYGPSRCVTGVIPFVEVRGHVDRDGERPWEWYTKVDVDSDDPLLARALAWRSVSPERT